MAVHNACSATQHRGGRTRGQGFDLWFPAGPAGDPPTMTERPLSHRPRQAAPPPRPTSHSPRPTSHSPRQTSHPPRLPALRAAADAVEAGFRLLARLRGAPALHPRGLTCTAELEVVTDGGEPWGVPRLDKVGPHEATVRLSRAAGLPRRLPDGLELAVRVPRADGPDRPLELLLTSSGRADSPAVSPCRAPTRWAGRTPAWSPTGSPAAPAPSRPSRVRNGGHGCTAIRRACATPWPRHRSSSPCVPPVNHASFRAGGPAADWPGRGRG
jgi:hypothetical protein